MLWLVQSTGRVCLCLQETIEVSHPVSLGQGKPDIHHSNLNAKLQSCLSSLHLLIWEWPDFLNAQIWCSLLLSEFRVLQLILVSASCAVWQFLCSWPFPVWHSCSQYKQEPRRSLSLHLQIIAKLLEFAGHIRTDLKDCIISQRGFLLQKSCYLNTWLRKFLGDGLGTPISSFFIRIPGKVRQQWDLKICTNSH